MENASKALIIAGAILVAILLISVGVIIIRNANIDPSSTFSEMEISQFNEKWTKYESTKQSASQVKALLSQIDASNSAEGASSNKDLKYVHLDASSSVTTRAGVKAAKTYTVECSDVDPADGFIDTIKITENT
jgi:hypothetical protein